MNGRNGPDLRLVHPAAMDQLEGWHTRYKYLEQVRVAPDKAAELNDLQLDAAIKWCEDQLARAPGGSVAVFEIAHQNLMHEWLKRGPTLRQAHADTMSRAGEGVGCPCCGKFVKRYNHGLSAGRVRALCWLVGASGQGREWVHVPTAGPRWLVKTNTHPTLVWWGLLERKPADDTTDTKHQGFWRPTLLGVRFARGVVEVPRRVSTYNAEVLGFSDEVIDVRTALGVKFNYQDEMRADGPAPIKREGK